MTVRRIRGSGTVMLSASGLPSDVRVTFNRLLSRRALPPSSYRLGRPPARSPSW
ncbi:MAG: hypothetical protein QI197_08205 [Candidatus Korarchaeota archaeon]|nr:hypothetical protein [Candidatus Korarchaeota archaeon]